MAIKREKVIRAAERYVSKGKLEAAINEYRKVLAENPTDANTLNRVGDLYARIERYDEAVKLFSQIAEQYTRDGFLVKAIAIYKKIIKLDPTTLPVYEKLAELYHRQGLLNEARTQYQVLADYYHRHDNPASAITIYQKMVEVDAQNPALHLRLAELYESQHLHEKAVREYSALAQMLIDNESVDEAGQVYIRAIEINAKNLALVRDVVVELRDGGHLDTAAKVLERAEELNPEAGSIGRLLRADGAKAKPEPVQEEPVVVEEEQQVEPLPLPALEAEPAISNQGWAAPEDEDADESGIFVLDLNDDEVPDSLVQPPADLLPAADPGTAEELELELESFGSSQLLDLDDTLSEPEPEVSFDLDSAADETSLTLDLVPMLDESDSTVPAPGAFAPAPSEEVLATGDEIEWSLEELADLEVPDVGVVAESPVAFELSDPELAEDAVVGDSGGGSPAQRQEDLLAEAQVFAKYGLMEKAQGRLAELLNITSDHLGGLALLATVELEAGAHEGVLLHAGEVARLAAERGEVEAWDELKGKLLSAGFRFDHGKLVGGPGPAVDEDDRIAALLEDLDIEAPLSVNDSQVIPVGVVPALNLQEKDDPVAPSGTSSAEPEVLPAAAPSQPVAAAAKPEEQLFSLADELDLEQLDDEPEGDLGEQVAAAEAIEHVDPLDETGLSWLDDTGGESAQQTASEESLFEEEDDFFDLAAELERELTEDQVQAGRGVPQAEEQSLEEIIEGFKRGVAENLSEQDYDTHFNLGIAYREMGLVDEAIGEFQLASKNERYLVECSSLLASCFLEKGLADLAMKWYRKGLDSPAIGQDEVLGLLYDMGNSYVNLGDGESAYKTFVEIFGINSSYRDISERLEALRQYQPD